MCIRDSCNPEKTDESIYISSFACAAETAAYDFKYTLDHANDFNSIKKDEKENKAFHLIQAFSPGEVSFEEAHAIGKELADKLLDGKYSYVLTTHIDKGHVPVSYTHLDVYKRQSMLCVSPKNGTFLTEFSVFGDVSFIVLTPSSY